MKNLLFAILALGASIYHNGWIDFNKNGRKDTFEDTKATMEQRIEDLLGQMTLTEKVCQMTTLYGSGRVLKDSIPMDNWKNEIWVNGIGNIDEQYNGYYKLGHSWSYPYSKHVQGINNIQRWFVEQTRLGIPVDFSNEGMAGLCQTRATFFPSQSTQGMSWDRDLIYRIGQAQGAEAASCGYTNIYSPVLDVAQDPRWGRVVECYGEDTYHVSELGRQMVEGLQGQGVVSTVKHFAVYSVPVGGRDGETRVDPKVPYREMRTTYLEPFRVAFMEAGAMGTMASYNDYDGDPVGASKYFLTDILRGEYGFKGYVVSDSRIIQFMSQKHMVAGDYAAGAAMCANAGLDVCTQFFPPQKYVEAILDANKRGLISEETIDERVRAVLRVKFWLGLFDNPYPGDGKRADALVHCKEHKELAHRAALEGMVLLKNDGLLPLDRKVGRIAVIGPNADECTELLQTRYGPSQPDFVTLFQGVKAAAPDSRVRYAKGCDIVDPNFPQSELMDFPYSEQEQALMDEAISLAKDSDVIILGVGGNNKTIGEAKSRTSLDLPGRQNDLVKAMIATGKPVVVVLIAGRAVTINYAQAHAGAILTTGYAGEFSGTALAEAIFGDYNPGGKMPVTVPKTVGQIPYTINMKPGADAACKGKTGVDGPLYAFGHGLSYTTFEYSGLKISPEKGSGDMKVSCTVKNTGVRDGDEVVQLYIRDMISSVTTYQMVLRGFERISLKAGESRNVEFIIPRHGLGLWNLENKFVVEPGEFKIMVGGASDDIRLEGSFTAL